MQKTIVVFSTAYLPLVGGAEVAVKEITDRLPEYRFVLFTAKIQPGLPTRELRGAVEVRRVGWGLGLFDKFLLVWWAPLLALRVRGVACVWAIMASYGGLAARIFCMVRPRARLLLTLQEGDSEEHIYSRMRFAKWMFSSLFRRADHIQAISNFLAQWARRMGAKCPVTVVPNGVDLNVFSIRLTPEQRAKVRALCGVPDTARIVVTVSRLVEKNGVQDLLESVAFLPDSYHLVIIGSGELDAVLQHRVKEQNWNNRVHFLGTLAHAEIPSYLAAADVFCRPSRSEGLGNVFLEAMAAGAPVVATPVGGIPDIVSDKKTGLMCEPGNPRDIAQKITVVVEDAALREQLVRAGQLAVAQDYDWQVVAQKMRALFIGLCAS